MLLAPLTIRDGFWHIPTSGGLCDGISIVPSVGQYIYMEYFEEMALGSAPLKPSMWLRCLADTFILWPHQEDVQILMNHVNSTRPSIQFTMEKEQDNKLSFLDILITRTEHGFSTTVYRKPTFTEQYLSFHPHHPYNVKKGIVRCLQHRAKAISCDEVYQKEMDSLKETLCRNNYPESITSATINLDLKTEEDTRKLIAVSPMWEVWRKRFKRYVIHTTSRRHSEVSQLIADICYESNHQQNTTWPRIVCTPSHAAVAKYTKVRHAVHWK